MPFEQVSLGKLYSEKEIKAMQMAMPGQANRQDELIRRLQEGPAAGNADVTRQYKQL